MIGNLYSVAELEDLLAQKDQEIPALESAWRAFDGTWRAWDPQADDLWTRDFNALKKRYGAARQNANTAIALAESHPGVSYALGAASNPFTTAASTATSNLEWAVSLLPFAPAAPTSQAVPDANIPADGEYRAVLTALQRQSGVVSPGDFQDLWNRLNAAIQHHATQTGQSPPASIYDPPAIQPRKGTDLALLQYQAARAATTPPKLNPKKASGAGKLLLVGAGLGLGGLAVAKVAGKGLWKTLWPF